MQAMACPRRCRWGSSWMELVQVLQSQQIAPLRILAQGTVHSGFKSRDFRGSVGVFQYPFMAFLHTDIG